MIKARPKLRIYRFADAEASGARETPAAAQRRELIREINERNREFWARPDPHIEQAGLAFAEQLRVLQKKRTAKASNGRKKIGGPKSERVEILARAALDAEPSLSQSALARKICGTLSISAEQTRTYLKKLKLPK